MKLTPLIVFILIFHFVSAQQDKNKDVYLFSYFKGNGDGLHLAYSFNGLEWQAVYNDSIILKPVVGNDKLMRDPSIIRGGDGKFHMVWTVSWNDKGIGYANSKDLVNWSEQQFIPVMEHEPGARNTWAPEITYDDKEGIYMIYWATTITGLFPETQAKSENAYNHRMYYTTTRDFLTFTDTKLLYEPGFNVIDASIVKDKNRFIMFLKDETVEPPQKNIKIAYSQKLTGRYSKTGPAITGDYWAEGPTALKKDNTWTVYFDKYRDHNMGAVQSGDLINWEDISEQISFPDGTRHGSVLTITKKEFEKLNSLVQNMK